jgi:hypothetical protein
MLDGDVMVDLIDDSDWRGRWAPSKSSKGSIGGQFFRGFARRPIEQRLDRRAVTRDEE